MKYFTPLGAICLTILMISCNKGRNEDSSIVIIGSEKSISNEVLYLIESEKSKPGGWKEFLKNRSYPGIHLVAEKQFLNDQLTPYKLRATTSDH